MGEHMDFLEFLESQRPDLTGTQRQQAIQLAREARQDAHERRLGEDRAIEAAERHERTALAARQMGVDPGSLTRASMQLGDAQAAVDDLRNKLERATRRRDSAARNMDHISRSLTAAAEAARGGHAEGVGDLTVEKQRHIQDALAGRPAAWTGG